MHIHVLMFITLFIDTLILVVVWVWTMLVRWINTQCVCVYLLYNLGRSNEFNRFWHILSEASSTGEYERVMQGPVLHVIMLSILYYCFYIALVLLLSLSLLFLSFSFSVSLHFPPLSFSLSLALLLSFPVAF